MPRFSAVGKPPAGRPRADPASHCWTAPTSTSLRLGSLACTGSAVVKDRRARRVASPPLTPAAPPRPVHAQQRDARQQSAGSRTQSQTEDVCAAGAALETAGDSDAKGATTQVWRAAALPPRPKGTTTTATPNKTISFIESKMSKSVETRCTFPP